ncbi:hypothetical protein ACM66B_003185 [Microbotryomycetes sp. NB124-2]
MAGDDDLMLNFSTSAASSSASKLGAAARTAKHGGGRWTDRVKDKRRQQIKLKHDQRATNQSQSTSDGVDEHTRLSRAAARAPVGPQNGAEGSSAHGPSSAHQQRARPKQSQNSNGQPPQGSQGKRVVGPDGKKQYISSLFSAEGLPEVQQPANDKPIVPSQPSNAPLRHDKDEDEADAPTETRPSPAPALSALGLQHEIVSHLVNKLDITGPTACQASAVPTLLAGISPPAPKPSSVRDAILQAQTGSGKTLTFLLPLVQDLLNLPPSVLQGTEPTRAIGTLAIVLAPTRELASQIYNVLEQLLTIPNPSSSSSFTVSPRALTPCLLVGGANRTHEKSRLRKGCPVVVATPGRLLDHLRTTEAFRFAGEQVRPTPGGGGPQGPPRGRTLPSTSSTNVNRKLGLRWLVVDECDRLMDLGFEEQMKGVLEEIEKRSPNEIVRRRTVLCSATANEGVDRLAGAALKDPVTLTVDQSKGVGKIVKDVEKTMTTIGGKKRARDEDREDDDDDDDAFQDENQNGSTITFTPPTQLVHNFVTCPPKLRFVTMLALLRKLLVSPQARQTHPNGTKILIFLSCTAAVDFYWKAIGEMNMVSSSTGDDVPKSGLKSGDGNDVDDDETKDDEDDKSLKPTLASYSVVLPGVPVYRLHGNLDLQTRLSSLAAFSTKSVIQSGKHQGQETENAVLLCTSVAARGLDVPFVGHVIQYDLPTEGGVTEYVHRVGRTARAGKQGTATSFVLPTEKEWVSWVQDGIQKKASSTKGVKLNELGVEEVLKKGFGGQGREYETRATDVQMGFERWVAADTEHTSLARNAFTSHVRAYATHPSIEKHMFNLRQVHLGHLAKSFGLREAPGAMGSGGDNNNKKKGGKRVSKSGHNDHEDDEDGRGGGFETGRRRNPLDAEARMRKLMRGPSGLGSQEFQIADDGLLKEASKGFEGGGVGGDGAGGKRKKRRR